MNRSRIGRIPRLLLLAVTVFLLFVSPVHAACTSPDRPLGTLLYNHEAKAFQGCTANGWKRLQGWSGMNPFMFWTDRSAELDFGTSSVRVASYQNKIAAVGNGGRVKISSDFGQTWTDRSADAGFGGSNIVTVAYHSATIFAASLSVVKVSYDDGATWTDITAAVNLDPGLRVSHIRYDGVTGVLTAAASISGNGRALMLTLDHGATWLDRTAPTYMHYSDVQILDNMIVTTGSINGEPVLFSNDLGLNWTNIFQNGFRRWSIAFDEQIIAVFSATSGSSRLMISENLGAGWTSRTTEIDLPTNQATGDFIYKSSDVLFGGQNETVCATIKWSGDNVANWQDFTQYINFGGATVSGHAGDKQSTIFGSSDGRIKVHGRCYNPLSYLGKIVYNADHDAFQGCTHRGWVAFHPQVTGAGTSCVNPNRPLGTVVYAEDFDVLQGCTKAGWVAFHALTDPWADSPEPGTRCMDGSFYIGNSLADGAKVYMTAAAYEISNRWHEDPPCYRCGLGNTGAFSIIDGRVNVDALRAYSGDNATAGNLDGFGAAKYCDNLTDVHGHSDWYLPAGGLNGSSSEINLIWQMVQSEGAVGGINTSGSWYWSSSESSTHGARVQRFSDGYQDSSGKDFYRLVRCVRR